jgi:predicted nucleotidyltransferase
MTEYGPLDLLGTIGVDHDYEDLLKHCVTIEVGGLRFNALDLQTLIEVKNETISEKDKAIIPILKRTLEEKNKK